MILSNKQEYNTKVHKEITITGESPLETTTGRAIKSTEINNSLIRKQAAAYQNEKRTGNFGAISSSVETRIRFNKESLYTNCQTAPVKMMKRRNFVDPNIKMKVKNENYAPFLNDKRLVQKTTNNLVINVGETTALNYGDHQKRLQFNTHSKKPPNSYNGK